MPELQSKGRDSRGNQRARSPYRSGGTGRRGCCAELFRVRWNHAATPRVVGCYAAQRASSSTGLRASDRCSRRACLHTCVRDCRSAARSEAAHRLAQAADVVDHRGDAGAERLQQRAGLVELCPVGKDGDRRLTEGAVEL